LRLLSRRFSEITITINLYASDLPPFAHPPRRRRRAGAGCRMGGAIRLWPASVPFMYAPALSVYGGGVGWGIWRAVREAEGRAVGAASVCAVADAGCRDCGLSCGRGMENFPRPGKLHHAALQRRFHRSA